ncbi:hypothetical protein ES319_A05G055000v1 [Gossypium barbadense]|uniref:Phytocyanin domain-containing protein n=2 Tax=Gossypium TaxID=3633 RepID=A0A5J5VJ99_GOSBA|nr:hypothetical protein ES319_A05G055000v1 [Gossypium barbadense]TYH15625.1 hypothetical protein ES288_A05G056900v1 [Gossypium darwinii]
MAFLRTLVWFSALAFVLFRVGEGKDILVGGSEDAWKIPKNASDSLNQWARKHRFKVGDFLNFKYNGKADSVLQVTEKNYESCNTSKPIKEYKNGNNTTKLEVTVISEKHRHHDNPPAFSPKPAIAPAPEPAKTSPNKALAYKDGTFLALTSLLGIYWIIIMGLYLAWVFYLVEE